MTFLTLIGTKINTIKVCENILIFYTNKGTQYYTAVGDCCSHSYFSEIIGADKLINQGEVVAIKALPSVNLPFASSADSVDQYGWQIVSDHPIFGEVTTFIGMRNESNGYYSGWAEQISRADALNMINKEKRSCPKPIVDNWMTD